MTTDSEKRTGGCLCGAVRYEIEGQIRDVIACHCTMCRKQTGHFLATADVWNEQFRLTEQSGLKWYRSSPGNRRGFCETCGSVLFFQSDGSEYICITAGTIDGKTGLRMAAHIFVADKGDYYTIDDGVDQFDGETDSVPMPERQ